MLTMKQLWHEDDGAILTAEFMLLATLLAIGLIGGIATLRDALITELADLAAAISHMDTGPAVEAIDGPDGGQGGGSLHLAADAFGYEH